MNEYQLNLIYDVWGHKLGWMSLLDERFILNKADWDWLEWRDKQEKIVKSKLAEWEAEVEREGGIEIYNEGDIGKKLVMVNTEIDAIEKQAETFSLESRLMFLELSPLDKLAGLRYRLRNQIMAVEVPDRVISVTDDAIEVARLVPLFKLIVNLPKTHKILCPFHQEKTPSFHVSKWGYCFGCGKHIDSIGWVMYQQGCSFVEAVKWLNGLPN